MESLLSARSVAFWTVAAGALAVVSLAFTVWDHLPRDRTTPRPAAGTPAPATPVAADTPAPATPAATSPIPTADATTPAAIAVRHPGELSLSPPDTRLDLDAPSSDLTWGNQFGGDPSAFDVAWGPHGLAALNGAVMAPVQVSAPTDCRTAGRYDAVDVGTAELAEGRSVCVRTNGNRLALITVTSPQVSGFLAVRITTMTNATDP